MNRPSKKDWRQVNLKVSGPVATRIDKILARKPHYTQQAIIIDAIEAGLAEVESREKAR
jgi:hypothetical protein